MAVFRDLAPGRFVQFALAPALFAAFLSGAAQAADASLPSSTGRSTPSTPTDSASGPELSRHNGVVRLGPGHTIAFTASVSDPHRPTLVFLPGLYRGWNLSDAFIQRLIQKKIDFVALQFSTHLASILSLSPGEVPRFAAKGTYLDGADLAREVEEVVVGHLGLTHPIAVSLSYSTLVSAHLDSSVFPVVIETAPMGRFDEEDLDSSRFGRLWLDWASLNPWGWAWAETVKTQTYFAYWSKLVAERALSTPELLNPVSAALQVQGYVSLTRASEGFDLRQINFATGPRRLWILAGQENPGRRTTQNEAIQLYINSLDQQAREGLYGRRGVFEIQSAGHTLPSDAPDEYVKLLEQVLQSL